MTTPAPAAPAAPVAAPVADAPVAAPVAAPAPSAPLALGDPAPAPVAAPVAVPVASPAPAPGAKAEPVTYEPTGDVGLDMALGFLGKLGIDVDHPGMKAAESGDFAILKATLAALGDDARGWEQFLALGEVAYGKRAEAAKVKAEADRQAVISAVGDEATWAAVQTWAAANAEPAERDAVNAALGAGGIAAKAMAQYLHGLYQNAAGTVVKPAPVVGDASRTPPGPGANGPLSPKDYAAEVAALNVKLRGRIDGSPEYAALQARRKAYRSPR